MPGDHEFLPAEKRRSARWEHLRGRTNSLRAVLWVPSEAAEREEREKMTMPNAGLSKVDASSSFYITGGTMPHDATSYVERAADHELYNGLRNGDYCHVLTARQMGKSSL